MPAHADPVASYTLAVSLDPIKHDLLGEGTITWRNASKVPTRELWVHLYLDAFRTDKTVFMRFEDSSFRGNGGALSDRGAIEVQKFHIQGMEGDPWAGRDKTSPGEPDDGTDIRVPLPREVAPGETLNIDVAWKAHLPALVLRTGHFGVFNMVAQWFPKLARLEPDGTWAHFPFHHLSEFYADYGRYDVSVTVPEGVVVGATGEESGEARREPAKGGEPAKVTRRFVQEDVHDFAFAAWDGFKELTDKSDDGVSLRILFPAGHEDTAKLELDIVRYGLGYLGAAYGRYPYKTLTIMHPPRGAEEAGGMEYPTLITTGGPWYGPYTGGRFAEVVTFHELGHQWFYGLVGTDEHAWPFLDEGLNSYAEADGLEHRFPGSSAVASGIFPVSIPALNRAGSADQAANAPVAQGAADFATGSDYGALVYRRTATILTTLGNVYGQDLVRQALGRYARRYRFQHPGPEELLAVFAEVVGADAAAQLRAALFDKGWVDYTVADVSSDADTEATDGQGYKGSVLVRRRGTLTFPVDVDLTSEDGTVTRVRWDGHGDNTRIPYRGKTKLSGAVVDPEHRVLLDAELWNNASGFPKQRVSGGVLERVTFAAQAALSGLLP